MKKISRSGSLRGVLYGTLGLVAPFISAESAVAAEEAGLQEVVVTAQKRAENIQDVSIAISAFSAETLAALGWTDITQVASQTPNLDIKYVWGNSMPVATIRGIGMNDFQANSKPGVGFYVDEVYLPSIALMGLQLFDMERLEVLKGPQGTLYGRNTNGGAINYITRKPTQESTAYVKGSFGRFDRFEYEAAMGGALSETISGRLSVFGVQQGKGHVLNRVSGKKHGEVDINAWRQCECPWRSRQFAGRLLPTCWILEQGCYRGDACSKSFLLGGIARTARSCELRRHTSVQRQGQQHLRRRLHCSK